MTLGQSDANFRSAERAYLEPPDERPPWTCPECDEEVYDEVCECGEREPDEDEDGPDPDRAYEEMRERRWSDD